MKYTLNELGCILKGKLNKETNLNITGVSTDTRKINPGDVFFAIEGESFDGHNFAQKAIEKGAVCVVAHKEISGDFPIIYVEDTLKAYGDLAKDYKSKFNINTIGVTGSVGKTSTKEFVSFLVELAGKTLKNEANFNNEIGVPFTLFNLDETYKNAIVEMGMRGKGQIDYLCNIAKPNIGIISNISICHIELLGSQDNIADAKCEILDNITDYGIVNGDSEYLPLMKDRCKCPLYTYGEKEHNDVFIKSIEANNEGFVYSLKTPWGNMDNIFIPGICYHNVINSMPAIITAKILGVNTEDIIENISHFKNIEKRFNIIDCGNYTLIDDSYNASPLAVEGSLKTLNLFKNKRKIACLGEMYELGDLEVSSHIHIGEVAKKYEIDELVAIGPIAKNIIKGFDNKEHSYYFENSELARDFMKTFVKDNDVILVKGSHGVHTEKIVEGLNI